MALEHRALLYRGLEEFLRVAVPFLRDGVRAGDAVVAVVREPGLGALRDSLSGFEGLVRFYDSEEFYRHPVRTLKQYQQLVNAMAPRRVRALAEPVWQGRDARETVEWARYESLINVVFGGVDALALCPYDRAALPGAVLDHARRTHPLLLDGGVTVRNRRYTDPVDFGDECDRTRRVGRPADADYLPIRSNDLYPLRAFVGERAVRHGLYGGSARNLVTAANEVAANALAYGCPPVGLWLWRDGRNVVCEVGDHGLWRPRPDSLTGFVPPGSALERGFGLWTVRLLVDLMELRTGWDGTFVRLYVA
ncbi:sensor histidine kinase [Actinomadura miaoliensis]|uniref:Sensor histidine kinase n=1 Tax=Actinomadura miaoliensis TaxID=430685 RepID=A0ABP7W4V9_9ACTN